MKNMTPFTFDIILRYVEGYGWLPIVIGNDKREIYRGEFRDTAHLAMMKAEQFVETMGEE